MLDLHDEREIALQRQRLYGAYPAEVTDIVDPDGQGKVKVRLLWCPDREGVGYEVWARLAVPLAGGNRGTWLIPDAGDEVLVMFEAGDPRRPYVLGSLWNGQDSPPEAMDSAGNNYLKSIVSRRDIRITFDDTEGQETLTLRTPQQSVVLADGGRSVEVRDANGNTVRMDAAGVTVTAAAKVTVQAGMVEVSAGMVEVKAGMSRFSGVVMADTVITNAVVSASYTPGAGNLL